MLYREWDCSDESELVVIVGDAKASSASEEQTAVDSWPRSTPNHYTN